MISALLESTLSHDAYPFERVEEFTDQGESLEVRIADIERATITDGRHLWQRFADFLPFSTIDETISLGEGHTPLLQADVKLRQFTGIDGLWLKNETQNPTWSFKDRGSLTCIAMAKAMGESVTATISTGNMGHSMAAYGTRAGIRVLVFVPDFTPEEKLLAMSMHGAHIIKVVAPDYSEMKKQVLQLAESTGLRIVSGNGPIRVEGYKLTSFELFEQMQGQVPDYIAVPTSACGHIRGLFKGYLELHKAGCIDRLPKMVVVQAANNSPLVSAIKAGKRHVVPFPNVHTIAEAITTGNPPGGDEIIHKAYDYGWPAEEVTEEEILISQKMLADSGFLVEPAAATTLYAVKKLHSRGVIEKEASVVLMLTGSGLKDMQVLKQYPSNIHATALANVGATVHNILEHENES
jgi:threonine synthase